MLYLKWFWFKTHIRWRIRKLIGRPTCDGTIECERPKPDAYPVDAEPGESPCGLIWSHLCMYCGGSYMSPYDCDTEEIEEHNEELAEKLLEEQNG